MFLNFRKLAFTIALILSTGLNILKSQSIVMLDYQPTLGRFEVGQSYESYKYFLSSPVGEYGGKWKNYTGLGKTEQLFGLKIEQVHLLFQDNKLHGFSLELQDIGTDHDNYDLFYIHNKLKDKFGEETGSMSLKGKDFQDDWKGSFIVCMLYYSYTGNGWSPRITILKRPDKFPLKD